MRTTSIKTNNILIIIHGKIIGTLIKQILFFNQLLLNLIHVVNKDDNQDNPFLRDKIQPHTKIIFQSQNPMNTQNYQTKSNAKLNPITILFTTT